MPANPSVLHTVWRQPVKSSSFCCVKIMSPDAVYVPGWHATQLITNFAIPPALVLTVLLVLPTPRVVKKGLLAFTRNVLFFPVLGNLNLVHVMIVLTGLAFTACSVSTYRLHKAVVDEFMTPNQKMGMLSKKWREERNFWIAALAFILWTLVHRFYALMLEYTSLRDENLRLAAKCNRLTAQLSQPGAATAAPPASAPPAPEKKPVKAA